MVVAVTRALIPAPPRLPWGRWCHSDSTCPVGVGCRPSLNQALKSQCLADGSISFSLYGYQ